MFDPGGVKIVRLSVVSVNEDQDEPLETSHEYVAPEMLFPVIVTVWFWQIVAVVVPELPIYKLHWAETPYP